MDYIYTVSSLRNRIHIRNEQLLKPEIFKKRVIYIIFVFMCDPEHSLKLHCSISGNKITVKISYE